MKATNNRRCHIFRWDVRLLAEVKTKEGKPSLIAFAFCRLAVKASPTTSVKFNNFHAIKLFLCSPAANLEPVRVWFACNNESTTISFYSETGGRGRFRDSRNMVEGRMRWERKKKLFGSVINYKWNNCKEIMELTCNSSQQHILCLPTMLNFPRIATTIIFPVRLACLAPSLSRCTRREYFKSLPSRCDYVFHHRSVHLEGFTFSECSFAFCVLLRLSPVSWNLHNNLLLSAPQGRGRALLSVVVSFTVNSDIQFSRQTWLHLYLHSYNESMSTHNKSQPAKEKMYTEHYSHFQFHPCFFSIFDLSENSNC